MVLDKVSVLEWYDGWTVRSANWETTVPSVVMLHEYMKCKTSVRFSKQNVFLRDAWTCQYCFKPLTEKTATMDHVLPLSKGGKTNFVNIVAACPTCNSLKGNDHRITPKRKPYKPDYWELVNQRKKRPFAIKHHTWKPYIEPHQIHHH
jgi:5-methylcytosine-specific restriction endonuclease McrA